MNLISIGFNRYASQLRKNFSRVFLSILFDTWCNPVEQVFFIPSGCIVSFSRDHARTGRQHTGYLEAIAAILFKLVLGLYDRKSFSLRIPFCRRSFGTVCFLRFNTHSAPGSYVPPAVFVVLESPSVEIRCVNVLQLIRLGHLLLDVYGMSYFFFPLKEPCFVNVMSVP